MALDFTAGCFGGCAGLVVGYPLDTIKVHIQTQDSRNPKFRGTWHCFRSIIANESAAALYRGMSSPIAGVTVVNAIIFGVYGQVQKYTVDSNNLSTHFISGAIAGLAQSPIASPLELAKTRLQLQSNLSTNENKFSGAIHCLKDIYKHAGLRGIFKGLGITALRETPGFGLYFLTYEALTRNNLNAPISTIHMLIAGGLAGTTSWIFTYPFDVIKSRLQADVHFKYSGAIDCFKKSLKEEGMICLFRGLNSTIIRAFPTNAATFAVVHWTFRIFDLEENSGNKKVVSSDNSRKQQINIVYHKSNQDSLTSRINVILSSLFNGDGFAESFCFAVASMSGDSATVNSDNSLPTSSRPIVEPDTAA